MGYDILAEYTGILGITKDKESGKYYAISGIYPGLQTFIELDCDNGAYKVNSETSIAGPPSLSIILKCLTSGPSGLFAINEYTTEVGVITKSDETSTWEPVSILPGPYSAYALAQDESGTLHYINGDGNHYTLDMDVKEFVQTGEVFPISSAEDLGFCGDIMNDEIITASVTSEGGIVKYSLDTLSITKEDTYPTTHLNDVTFGSLVDGCKVETASPTLLPTVSPTEVPTTTSPTKIPTISPTVPKMNVFGQAYSKFNEESSQIVSPTAMTDIQSPTYYQYEESNTTSPITVYNIFTNKEAYSTTTISTPTKPIDCPKTGLQGKKCKEKKMDKYKKEKTKPPCNSKKCKEEKKNYYNVFEGVPEDTKPPCKSKKCKEEMKEGNRRLDEYNRTLYFY